MSTMRTNRNHLASLPPITKAEVVLTALSIAGLVGGIALSGAKKTGEASIAIAAGTFFYGLLRKLDQKTR